MKRIIGFFFLWLCACNIPDKEHKETEKPVAVLRPKYAQGFWIEIFNNRKLIHVRNAYDTTHIFETYELSNQKTNTQHVSIPPSADKVVCLSTTQIGFLEALQLTDSIIGVSDAKRIYNARVLKNLQSGKTFSIGENGNIQEEDLLSLNPSLIFAYSFNEANSSLPKLRALGLNVVLINDYNEIHPLARAEWIKMIAAFYHLEHVADSIFNEIEFTYNTLAQQAKEVKRKPTVFCNLPWKEVWYMPSGKSYFAKFIEDAGGDYLWKNDTSGRTLSLDLEAVYAKAANAEVWLNPNSAKTLREIEYQNPIFRHFNAFARKTIFNFNKLENQNGGNAFWETGVVQPHVVLKDLMTIFHPSLFSDDSLTYYQPLKDGK
jgi:iron complex transport system substrate-binding protein